MTAKVTGVPAGGGDAAGDIATPLSGSAAALTVVNDGADGNPFVATWTALTALAVGASSADLKVCTLPAKTYVKNAYMVVTGKDVSGIAATFTVALGRVAADYIDYIVASDWSSAATVNAVYGNASGERGTNLTAYDLPSWTATTDVFVRFVVSGAILLDLSESEESSGVIVIEYGVIP